MKLCAVQIRPFKGDILKNIDAHKKFIELAIVSGADIIVFPELSITGYEPSLSKELVTTQDDHRLDEFQHFCDNKNIIIGVGMPIRSGAGIHISMLLFQAVPETAYILKTIFAFR